MFNFKSLIVALLSSAYFVENASASIECGICQGLYEYASLSSDKETIKKVQNVLDALCPLDPSTDGICTSGVAKIADLIGNGTGPYQACTLFELCNASGRSKSSLDLVAENIVETPVHYEQCNKCLSDFDSLRTDLKLAHKEHLSKLRGYCSQFSTTDDVCDSYIKTSGSMYDALESNLVPEKVCGAFGVCSSSQINPVTMKQSRGDKLEPDCFLCKRVLKLVDQVIGKQAKYNIELAFDKVCNTVVPSSSRRECRKFVDKYTTQLINFITEHTDPDEICNAIGMCKEEPDYTNDMTGLASIS